MPTKDSWPEESSENNHRNNVTDDEDDDDDDDLFQDDIWNNLGDIRRQETNVVDINNENDHHNDYILISQYSNNNNSMENGDGGVGRLYRHNYQVEWIQTDEPLFNTNHFNEQQQSIETNINHDEHTNNTENQQTTPICNTDSDNQTENMSQQQQDRQQIKDLQLDNQKIDTIKNLMANFKLPDENYPSWAKDIPEEEWQNRLKKLKKDI